MDQDNVKLGVCRLYANGVEMGLTIGGAEGIYTPEFHKTKVDQYTGTSEQWLIGESWGAKVRLAESTVANLKRAITHATEDGSNLTIGSYAGKRSSSKAFTLVLHPIANEASDRSEDWIVYKAVSTSELNVPFKNDGEKVLEIMFEGLVDETKSDGNMLGMIGDSAA